MTAPMLPPSSPESEQALLGAVLLDNRAFDRAADILHDGDFYDTRHRAIWRALCRLIESGKPADIVTICDALERSNAIDDAGGPAYIAGLSQTTPGSSSVRRYAEIIRERALLRAVQSIGMELQEATASGNDAQEVVSAAEEKLLAVLDTGTRDYSPLRDALAATLEQIDKAFHRGGALSGVPTGYADLDRMTGGLEPGDLIIVAGRPSMGKTAFALNIAEHVARARGPVALFSLEMSQLQLSMRLLAGRSRVPMSELRRGALVDRDWESLTESMAHLTELPVFIDDTAAVTCTHIRSRARRIQREQRGLAMVVVDYLQLMRGRGDTREQEVSGVSRGLKAIAKELGVPVLCLSQLNRALTQRQDKRPVLADLRESGAIEQDADLIMFVHREEVYDPDTWQRGCAQLLIRKQRNGPIGEVWLTYLDKLMRFEDCAEPPQAPVSTAPARSRGFNYRRGLAGDGE